MQASQQHVASCVKRVEWGLGPRGLRIHLKKMIDNVLWWPNSEICARRADALMHLLCF